MAVLAMCVVVLFGLFLWLNPDFVPECLVARYARCAPATPQTAGVATSSTAPNTR